MSEEVQYVKVSEEGDIAIQEEGFIDLDNIGKMKFTFQPGQDITESLAKKKQPEVSAIKKGRTGYTPMKCTYPNGTETSSKIVLTDCIIQWRQGIDRPDSDYASTYVCIGVPDRYITKIIGDAKRHSGINLGPKDNVQHKNEHYWFGCNLSGLRQDNTWIIYTDKDGETQGSQGMLREILKDMNGSLLVDVMVSISGSLATEELSEKLPLKDGMYTITMKPTEVFIRDTSRIEGPILEDTNRRDREVTEGC